MSNDYLPNKESDLKTFANNFAALILANPNIYSLVANDGTVIDAAAKEFATRYDLATAPPTRNTASIIQKNDAKAALIPILRGYAMLIKANRAVENSAKANLGLSVDDQSATPVPAPQTQPIVSLVGMTGRRHVLRFADMLTPDSRVKPDGVEALQLFYHVGEAATPPADPLAARFHAVVTRCTTNVDFALADGGKTAYYFARWQTGKGLVGPWSDMVRAGIAG